MPKNQSQFESDSNRSTNKIPSKRKSKVNRHKFFNRLLMLLLIGSVIGYGLYSYFKSPTELVHLRYGTVQLTSNHAGVILRDEVVVYSMNAGVFTPEVLDGERVKKNQRIGAMLISEKPPAAEGLQATQTPSVLPDVIAAQPVLVDQKTLEGEARAIYVTMIDALKSRRFVEAENMKKELNFKLDRLKRLKEESSANAFYLQANRTGSVGSQNATSGQTIPIQAIESGLVSYYFDQMEAQLHYENRYKIMFEQLFKSEIPTQNHQALGAKPQEPLFKIVSPEVWYLACQISLDEFDLFKREAKVTVQLGTEQVDGRVEETFASGAEGVLILRLTQQASMMHNQRKVAVTLVRDEVKGLLLPKDALVKKDGQDGAYSVNRNRQVVFKPVHIIATKESDYIVVEGHFTRVNDKGETIQIQTLQEGEQILRTIGNLVEGDILE